jgi:hypothetical protein
MHAKMEFCANCAVNMIQNISAQRENKRITINSGIFNGMSLSGLTKIGQKVKKTSEKNTQK